MKTLIALISLLVAGITAHAQLPPGGCITNITLTPVNGTWASWDTSSNKWYQTQSPIDCGSGGMVGSQCALDSTCIHLYCPCASFSRVAANLSWQCYGQCGTGGSLAITMPAFADSCTIYIFGCGDCCLTYCQGGVDMCSPPTEQ